MRLLLDESAEIRIATFLKEQGHDVTAVAHDYHGGLADVEVLSIAVAERRILVTNDRDFGELIFRRHLRHTGVIYFRLPLDTTAAQKVTRLEQILVDWPNGLDLFIVVDPRRTRIRQPSR